MKKVFTIRAFVQNLRVLGFAEIEILHHSEACWVKSVINKTREQCRSMGYCTEIDWFEDITVVFADFLRTLKV